MEKQLTYMCPSCGCEARVGAPCPGCPEKRKIKPSKVTRSWEQDGSYDALDLPDEDFDYDEFVAKEFGGAPHSKLGVKWYWWLLAIVILLGMASSVFRLF